MRRTASFRFGGNLNDFLRKHQRHKPILYSFEFAPAVKDAIEALGIPHPEVALICINHKPADFYQPLQNQDVVEVFPQHMAEDIPPAYALRPALPPQPSFVLDVHLGKLAKSLRLLGFDTAYQNNYTDETIAKIAAAEHRIVLTRDVGLLKQKIIQWGYWLRASHPPDQLKEVLTYFSLVQSCRPFTRCLACNGLIRAVEKDEVLAQLPPKTKIYFEEFYRCPNCQRIYWKGSHYEHMLSEIAKILPSAY